MNVFRQVLFDASTGRLMQKKQHCWNWIALAAGALLPLAFSPFDLYFLAPVSIALLFQSWLGVSPLLAALRGYLFGLGQFGLGVSWVFISVYDYADAGLFLACLLTGIFVGFWALFPALAGYFAVRFKGRYRFYQLLIFSSVWVLIEFLRGQWVLNGFPWLQIAYSQLDTPLAGYVPLTGGYGVSWLLVVSASLLVYAFGISNRGRSSVCFILLLVWGIGYYLSGIQWTRIDGTAIKVSMVQGNIAQDKKWAPEYRDRILQMYSELTRKHWDSELIIWPESAVPAFFHQVEEDFLLPLEKEAIQNKTDILLSLPMKTAEGKKYNSVLLLGRHRGWYHKIHLLPFGEYLPLQPLSGYLLDSLKTLPVGSFSPGSRQQKLLEVSGFAFNTSICYEDVFAELSTRQLDKSAFLVNVTNDGWFGDSIEPHQHMQMARMRAIETGRYMLRATNNGITAFVSPHGKVIRQAPMFAETVLTDKIFPMTGLTPYAVMGDRPVIVLLLLILFLGILINRQCRRA